MYPRAHELMDSSVYSNPEDSVHGSPESSVHFEQNSSSGEQINIPVPQRLFHQYIPPTQYTPEISDLDLEQRNCDVNITRSKVTHLPREVEWQSTTRRVGIPGSFPDVNSLYNSLKHSKYGENMPATTTTIHPPDPLDQTSLSFSTPVKQRLSTSRPHDDERRLMAAELIPLLQKELAFDTNTSQTSTFIDLLFPSSRLPFPIDDTTLKYLEEKGYWNVEDALFCKPFKNYKESSIADWLNVIGRLIGLPHDKKRVRLWHAGTCNNPPEGSPHIRKPDIILLDRAVYLKRLEKGEKYHWRMIRAFAEVTAQKPFPKRIIETVNEKSYLFFLQQDDRRFVPALSFDGSGCFSLTISDRQGQIRLAPMSLFSPGKDVALVLLKILAFLMYGPPDVIGLDPSMLCDETGKVRSILVSGQTFTVVKRIYSLQALVGRGTKIYVVSRGGNRFILKDSWVLAGRLESEIDFLDKFAQYPGLKKKVPALIEGEDIKINGELDSTERYRLHIGQINKHRVHRRHVTEPIGTPIVSFTSKVEFLSVIIDAVKILQTLYDDVGVLHRDISPNNILYVHDSKGKARCLLIDFDYAVTVGKMKMQQASHGFRMGTPPFMALEIMLQSGKNFCHELRHDLESLLYVVLWMCNHMVAPGIECEIVDGNMPHIRGWCNMALSLQELGHRKLSHIVDADRIILAEFTPYWEDFKPFAQKLLAAFFPISPAKPNKITSGAMLAILNEARSVVKEPHASRNSDLSNDFTESKSVPQIYATLAGFKRDRQGQDVVSVSKRVKQGNDRPTRFVSSLNQFESIGPD